ncbi:hypothetical protein PHLCEN_2v5121 [Hermanssonia centrifuga]|uniref:Uncharacterized protein n=1 Tax=Hermanssonia centrifuga TaxID=98765 RepID=A0A2R6PBW9_9APHY|nr:hypothetical protein PHLCEN_2v5121 [Hermanssonia centrifuga]
MKKESPKKAYKKESTSKDGIGGPGRYVQRVRISRAVAGRVDVCIQKQDLQGLPSFTLYH